MDVQGLILPEHLWAKIAKGLSFEYAIRLSSTCRSLRRVLDPSECLDMEDNMTEGSWRWLVEHWGPTKSLSLCSESPDSWVTPSQAAGLTNLELLTVMAVERDSGSGQRFPEWLAGMLQHCSALRVLTLVDISPFPWPALAALRHLEMEISEPQLEALLDSLPGMHGCLGLRTVSLLFHSTIDTEMPPLYPMLDISGARHLQRLTLIEVRFAQLVLPDSCTLECSYWGEHPPEPASLDLTSMNNVLVAAKLSFPRLECNVLEGLGSRCQCLHFDGNSLGSPSTPMRFPRDLTSLTVLELCGKSFHITLPQTMQLTNLRIEAVGRLEVSIESAGALSKTLVYCEIQYHQLQGTDLQWLFLLLAAAGKSTVPIERTKWLTRKWVEYPLQMKGMQIDQDTPGNAARQPGKAARQAKMHCACLCLEYDCGCEEQCRMH